MMTWMREVAMACGVGSATLASMHEHARDEMCFFLKTKVGARFMKSDNMKREGSRGKEGGSVEPEPRKPNQG